MYASQMRRAAGPLTRAAARSLAQPKVQARSFNRRALQPWNDFPSFPSSSIEGFMRDVDRQFQQMEQQMNSVLKNFGLARPLLSTRGLRPPVESELVSEGNPSMYSLHIDLGENVDPEKVKLTLKDRVLSIEAKVEHQSEDGNSRLYQEITRKIMLPENVDPKDVKSQLTPDGYLLIEATLPAGDSTKPKEIPIQMEQQQISQEEQPPSPSNQQVS